MAVIELDHITAGYGTHIVLKELSASFPKGSLTSVIGVNGCGKSTLLKVIHAMVPVSSGVVTIDGEVLKDMSRKQLARKIAYLPQEKATPDMTVEQIVLHGRFPHLQYPRCYTKQDREIAAAAMKQAGIADLAHKSLHTLSGGMRQNAYIAMALAQETEYILLDEPTTFLDISHQLALMKTLKTLAAEGKGIVAVMHDLPMALTFSDNVVLLNNGQVAAAGEPRHICEQKIIDSIFGVTMDRTEDGQTYHYRY